MRIRQDDCISSQQTPDAYFYYERRYKKSPHAHMLIEDFSGFFSTELTSNNKRDQFYDVEPVDDRLKSLLLFGDYSNLGNNFDRLLSSVMDDLLLNGKAYIEIVSLSKQDGIIQGIKFIPVHAMCCWKRRNECVFLAKNHNNKKIYFRIKRKHLVEFKLKDLGLGNSYFRKLINHMALFDATSVSKLVLDPKLNGIFNFTDYQKSIDYKLLKYTRQINWLGRNYSNQHLSESYLLYRSAQYKMLRFKFLQYILSQINEGLDKFKTEWEYSGKIITTVSVLNYKNELNQYNKGEINASQLCDIVIKNLVSRDAN